MSRSHLQQFQTQVTVTQCANLNETGTDRPDQYESCMHTGHGNTWLL